MEKEIKFDNSLSINGYDRWVKSHTYICPKCGSSDVVYDCTTVLTSMPPQHKCKCNACGEEFFSGQCQSNYTNKDSSDDMWKQDQSILNIPKIEDPLPGQQWSDPFRLPPPSHNNNYGWICPKCGRALAPHLDSCKWCSEINSTITLNTINTEAFDNLKKMLEDNKYSTITISGGKNNGNEASCNRDCESC